MGRLICLSGALLIALLARTVPAKSVFPSDLLEGMNRAIVVVSNTASDIRAYLGGSVEAAEPIEESAPKVAQIIRGPVPVRAELSPDAPILGMANKGASFPLIHAGDSWVRIVFNGKEGWVERRLVTVAEAPTPLALKEGATLVAAILGVLLVFFVVLTVARRGNKVRGGWIKSAPVEKNLLIVASEDQPVRRYLTGSTTTISKCFSEIGFHVQLAKNSNALMKMLVHMLPDVMVVDWGFAPNVHNVIERALSSKSTTANVFVVFYNVPDPAKVQQSRIIPNAQYVGLSFTDRELFSLVTPLIITGNRAKEIRKSVEISALEGEIGGDSLLEVFQFVEIGQKTGCLLIENNKPLGIIHFRNGIIVYAATERATAKDAVFEVLGFVEGRFRFVLEKEPKTENCRIPTLGILMEWTKEFDEAHGR